MKREEYSGYKGHRNPSYVKWIKENLITPVERNTVPSTGPLVGAGTTLHAQARRIFVDVGPIFLEEKISRSRQSIFIIPLLSPFEKNTSFIRKIPNSLYLRMQCAKFG